VKTEESDGKEEVKVFIPEKFLGFLDPAPFE
jgi:hypothetical protein